MVGMMVGMVVGMVVGMMGLMGMMVGMGGGRSRSSQTVKTTTTVICRNLCLPVKPPSIAIMTPRLSFVLKGDVGRC